MILGVRVFRYDGGGAPRDEAELDVKKVLARVARYWADPYSNLGSIRRVNRNKSHPGVYRRRGQTDGDGYDPSCSLVGGVDVPEAGG